MCTLIYRRPEIPVRLITRHTFQHFTVHHRESKKKKKIQSNRAQSSNNIVNPSHPRTKIHRGKKNRRQYNIVATYASTWCSQKALVVQKERASVARRRPSRSVPRDVWPAPRTGPPTRRDGRNSTNSGHVSKAIVFKSRINWFLMKLFGSRSRWKFRLVFYVKMCVISLSQLYTLYLRW